MDSIANGYGCRPCKIKQVQLDVTDAILHFIGDGSALSNLNASNVAFGTLSTTVFPVSGVTAGTYGSSSNISQITVDQYGRVTSATNVTSVSSQWTGLPGSSIYYIPGVSVGSSDDATANLQVTGNVYVSNSVTTQNVFATAYYGDGGLLSNVASQWSGTKGSPIYYIPGVSVGSSASATANLQVTGNVYVSNAVTVPNVHVTDTIDVTGSLTANAANATFFFDTFTIPYINTQYLNVSSNTTLTGNLVVATANIATLNVGYLTVNSAVVYGATTLNVYGTSNLTNVTASNLYASNVFVSKSLDVGPGTLGSNVVIFSNVSGGSNTFIMDSNARVSIGAGAFGGGSLLSFGRPFANKVLTLYDVGAGDNPVTATNFYGFGIGTNLLRYQVSSAANHGFYGASSEYARITSTGVSILTGADPTSNLQVTGNAYISNAVTTTNVFASTVSTTNPISFRNRVINGDFFIDQRNAGASSTPTVDPTRTIDRWKVNIVGSGRCQVGQNLGAFAYPTGFTSYYGMKVTTTSTVNAGDYFFLSQVIEGINVVDLAWGTASAKPVTLSFWVLSSLAGTAGGFVRNAGATAGNYTRSYPFTFTINNILTWEYKTVTIPGDTTGQWLANQTDGVEFGIELWNGTSFQGTPNTWGAANYTGPSGGTINYVGSLNANMNITGVQFESGSIATPYERRHIDVELAMCQRYYEPTVARLGGYNTAGGSLRSSVYFNTKKRPAASPTLTVISQLENTNMGSLNLDNSNFDQSSARILASVTATGDAYGQWKVSVDCEF